jgi:hypothetical protein
VATFNKKQMTPSTRSFGSVQLEASPTSKSWFRDVQERIRRNVRALKKPAICLGDEFPVDFVLEYRHK